jgi:hypothetical protein
VSLLTYHVAQAAPAAIPYRTDAAVSTGSYALALLITLCLLGLLVAALLFVRRRGWISWSSMTRTAASPVEDIALQASRRLSMGTTAYVVSYRGQAYLIVESTRGTSATVTPMAPHPTGGEGTS